MNTNTYTLRQAHKLVEKITARMATLDLSPTREVNAWEVTDQTFSENVAQFKKDFERFEALVEARHLIRQQIGAANHIAVDGLIARRKYLLDQIGMLRTLVAGARVDSMSSPDALFGKATALVTAATAGQTTRYGSHDTVSICVLSKADIDDYNKVIDRLQLEVESVEDQLTTANASRENAIIVSDQVIATLQREGIVA